LIFHIQFPLGYKGDSSSVDAVASTETGAAGESGDGGAIQSFSLESTEDLTADPTLAAEEIIVNQSETNTDQSNSLTEETDASGEASEENQSAVTSANADTLAEPTGEAKAKEDEEKDSSSLEDSASTEDSAESSASKEVVKEEQPEAKYANIGISIAKDYVNIRKDPSTDGEILGKLYKNSACTILKTEGEWYYVESGAVKGYAKAEFIKTGLSDEDLIKNYSTQKIIVDVDGLNVREEKSTESKKLTVVYQNEKYPVEQIDGEWIKIQIEDENITGYVKAELVELVVDFTEAVSKEEEQLILQLQAEERAKKETIIIQNVGYSYTAEDLELLACLVHSEAGTQSYEGKLAVANVVLNRMKSSKYPDTIKAVIYQSGQFSVARSGSLEKQLNYYDSYSSKSQLISIKAAKDALEGANNIGTRMYFHSYKAAVKKGYDLITSSVKIGDHLFW
jgi:uncharacterized protein YgiM (DUF1202 family)